MENKENSGLIAVIFNGIAALVALITLVSPLFFDVNFLTQFFVEKSAVRFIVFISLIAFILMIWLFVSVGSFILFGGKDIKDLTNLEKVKLNSIILFLVFSLCFYGIHVLYIADGINASVASVLQFFSFTTATTFLAIALGQTISSSIATYNNRHINETRDKRIISTLLQANLVKLDLKILAVYQDLSGAPGREWAYFVLFETNRKKYNAIFYGDFSRIIDVQEFKPTVSKK